MRSMRTINTCRRIVISLAILAWLVPATAAMAEGLDPRIEAVKNYLLGDDYPELFDDKPYHVQVRDIAVGDLDGDGQAEVVLMVAPHYLQSPTILIFQVNKQMQVTRVREGLAPGPVEPLTGDYLDSHTLSEAVDLTLGKDQNNPAKRRQMVAAAMRNGFGGIVEYRNFFHMDHRSGKGMYLDMTRIDLPARVRSCGSFQFSEVEAISIASRKHEKGNYLLAKVGDEVYAYRIRKITKNGLLEKELQILKP